MLTVWILAVYSTCVLCLSFMPQTFTPSPQLTFSGWTQRSGGHPTRHRPERRWACRLWRWRILCSVWRHALHFIEQNTYFTARRAWKSNMLTQYLSLLVCFHHSVSLLNTHIFQSISNPNMCGWYPNTMLIVKWGDEGSRSACQIISIARDYGTS